MLLLLSCIVVTCDVYLLTASRVFIRKWGALASNQDDENKDSVNK